MTDLKKVLMSRDKMSSEQADQEIKEMRNRVLEGEDPEEILLEIGLEPDYIFDLL
jgi:hypothetical protein